MRTKHKVPKKQDRPDRKMKVEQPGELMTFLLQNLEGKSRQNIKSLLGHKQVLVNDKAISQFNHPLNPGDIVSLQSERTAGTANIQHFTIVYEDEYLLVIDKQEGILTIATDDEKERTVYHMLREYVKRSDERNKIFVVHRLDRETSGLLLFAKTPEVKAVFQENWHEIITERTYVAVAEGVLEKTEGSISSFLYESPVSRKVHSSSDASKGKKAITHYQVLARKGAFSLLELHLETGRKNQIRVHLQQLGHPIVNDRKYGSTTNPIRRLGLHSRTLAFQHPVSGKPMRFSTAVPRKFLQLF
ncbi:MAG: RluA family pseudouridine synthase [Prolixibacteraceae bacterium]|nr:RluA family pseudouridine synthase [Prolixibacteraceae bacterium]